MPIDYGQIRNIGMTGAQAFSEGQRNRLIERSVEKENTTNELLAQMTMPGATPEVQNALLQQLMATNPQAGQNYLVAQQTQRDMDWQEKLRTAQEGMGRSRAIRRSSNPVAMLEYLDEEGTLRQMGTDMGFDMQDPADVDELMGVVEARYSMMVGAADESRMSAAIGDMKALGYEMTPEGFAQYNEDRGAEGLDMFDAVQTQLAIESLRLQNEARERESREAEDTAAREALARESNVMHGIEQASTIISSAEQLQGSFLEAGVPFSKQRRAFSGAVSWLEGAVGMDNTERAELNDSWDTMTKNMNDQLIALMESSTNMGQATDAKLRQYQASLANPDVGLGAIMDIEAGILETYLEVADHEGFEVENREQVLEEIDRMKRWSRAAPDPVIDVPGLTRAARETIMDISTMTREQLDELDIDSDTPDEVLRAASNRMRALQDAATGQ